MSAIRKLSTIIRHPESGDTLTLSEAITAWNMNFYTSQAHHRNGVDYVTEYRVGFPGEGSWRISEYAWKSRNPETSIN